MTNFTDSQAFCNYTFSQLGLCWHLYTPENCEIIFRSPEDYNAGMSLFGIAALLCPKVKVLTFEIMSNHIHSTLAGSKEDIIAFFKLYASLLSKYFKEVGHPPLPKVFELNLRQIESLEDLRNVLIYNNRNGYLVHPEHSPFSYPYGANAYFFNPFAKELYNTAKVPARVKELERMAHTHAVRSIEKPVYYLNGHICPLCFCDIVTAEQLFRDAAHYFHSLSRSIESQRQIAREIGDRVFYTDDELYSTVYAITSKKYGLPPAQLPRDAKTEMSKTLHYDYNANNKQIARILKLDLSVVSSLFPR
ncbi:MAG: hypothetical protein J5748_00310 [Bacteroidales bacterium]|nr:hypothetical protein [Bacteroidales bacterium]